MTKLRVVKFTYNAQGCSLANLGKPLYDEDIEAWKHGPVTPSVYGALSSYKEREAIKKTVGRYSKDVFSPEQISLLRDVAVKYGRFTTGTLVAVSHFPNGPWSKVYDEKRRHIKISKESIREYFSQNEPLDGFDLDRVLKFMKPLGPSDPEGNTILPADFDD